MLANSGYGFQQGCQDLGDEARGQQRRTVSWPIDQWLGDFGDGGSLKEGVGLAQIWLLRWSIHTLMLGTAIAKDFTAARGREASPGVRDVSEIPRIHNRKYTNQQQSLARFSSRRQSAHGLRLARASGSSWRPLHAEPKELSASRISNAAELPTILLHLGKVRARNVGSAVTRAADVPDALRAIATTEPAVHRGVITFRLDGNLNSFRSDNIESAS